MANNTSQHILSTSANLLGFCLLVITSLHITNKAETSIVDELTSIRTSNLIREKRFETAADYLFFSSLIGILIIILIITLNLLK